MQTFTEDVIRIIKEIPEQRVMTYGQIAAHAGNKRAARQVSRILHSMSKNYKLPWHRVINQKGEISLHGSEQRELLEAEGVQFGLNGKIELKMYQWRPPSSFENGDQY